MKGRVLIIAGSDSGGGAGLQADIKAVSAMGAYAATAVTAITVQDTNRVHEVYDLAPALIRKQIDVVLKDIGADVIKVGMIGTLAAGRVVRDALIANPNVPVVLDPVLVATSGDALGADGMAGFIHDELVPLSAVVTPNLPELHALAPDSDEAGAAAALLRSGAKAVLVKGGHEADDIVTDRLYGEGFVRRFQQARIRTMSTHGTGCTLASALAAGLAQGMDIEEATDRAVRYVHDAIEAAPKLGSGHGPVDHTVWNGEHS
jgi:hydroxymethylpyrimidine/phosphomethylpyrimidine kinase